MTRIQPIGQEPIAASAVGVLDQATADYAALFASATAPGEASCRVARAESGLVTLVLRHGGLTSVEADLIGRYRLQQYMHAGLYNPDVVAQLGLRIDPAMASLEPVDLHVAVGDREGHFLCYACLQSSVAEPSAWLSNADNWLPSHGACLRDGTRPFFPCESEYGLDVYGSHPEISRLRVDRVRELTRFVRNHVLRTSLDGYAVLEALVAVARVVCDPQRGIEALVGCASPEVRRLMHRLGIPIVYAPFAPIIGDNWGGRAAGNELLWTDTSHTPGRFWPFAIAASDVRAQKAYFDELEAALALPLDEIAAGVRGTRRGEPLRRSTFLPPPGHASGIIWVSEYALPHGRTGW